MSDIKVRVDQQNTVKVRVGQQNAVKVISSISGSSGGEVLTAKNVVGGIASVTSLNVSGISTFVGIATFKDNVYIDGDLYIANTNTGGIAYFNASGLMVSTGETSSSIDYSNYILTTDNAGIPVWSNTIDGGSY